MTGVETNIHVPNITYLTMASIIGLTAQNYGIQLEKTLSRLKTFKEKN